MTRKQEQSNFINAIGLILRLGVFLSSFIVIVGAVMYLIQFNGPAPQYGAFDGEPKRLTSLRGVFHGASSFHSQEIIQLGLLALIATPVARVIFCFVEFLKEKDWTYSLITVIVLAMLSYSIIFAR